MLKALTHDTSNKRFIAYVVLFYVLAMTAGAWVPPSSPAFAGAIYIKLLLVPLAHAFLLKGARVRWPDHYPKIALSAILFYVGLIISIVASEFM
ncbi:hypothetical protein NPS53_07895 [Pseudomonas putida]|uniref:hypothetical protein n=1 Tax=Pseudomonas putida TaxID=303 RepID=UPI0023648864|nr:hypothetical protein [Pseudomonas putida]MDD2139491.1 hypothetical protein [Pseudomonas putida]HDS1721820.1 hypothetical protein [Pseudomonas putida]